MNLTSFEKEGFVVIDDFFTPKPLWREASTRYQEGAFREAGIGKSGNKNASSRSDEILWWEELTAPQKGFYEKLETLRTILNREFYFGLHDWEGHYARYAPGAFYERHLDRFRDDDRRVISTVFYLNPEWKEPDQGTLVLYPPDRAPKNILPQGGRLVVFLSDQIPHEVLPAARERWSVAGWFRRR